MTSTLIVEKDKLKGIIDVDNLIGTLFRVTVSPLSEAEIDELEFKSLKGSARKPLDLEKVRKERLKL